MSEPRNCDKEILAYIAIERYLLIFAIIDMLSLAFNNKITAFERKTKKGKEREKGIIINKI